MHTTKPLARRKSYIRSNSGSQFLSQLYLNIGVLLTALAAPLKPLANKCNVEPITNTPESLNMKLIYRANIFEYTPRPERPYCKPRVLNWRFQTPEWRNSGCLLPYGTT